jgi:3-(3-hydroxy-phenyl)propionate hydroxylase
MLLERETALPVDLRASTFHPPSLDMLDGIGVTGKLLPIGLKSPTYQYRDRRTGDYALFDLALLEGETRHPYRLQCEQYKMTRVIVDMLAELASAEVRFGHGVTGVEDRGDRVDVHVETPSGPERLQTRYVVGADGASSRVRKSIGVEFEGFTYPEKFLVVSTDYHFPEAFPGLSNVNYVSDPDEWCVILRTPEIWRVLFPTEPGASDELLLSDDFIEDRLQHLAPRPERYRVVHRTLYRVHQRVAETYRKGNVLIAGDAAHINNPLGGMGMNGGLHDAFSLGEKLVAILRGHAEESLLDVYSRQRRQIALDFVQEHTIRNKRLMEEKDPELQAKRQAEFVRTAEDPELARRFLLKTSMIQPLRDLQAVA